MKGVFQSWSVCWFKVILWMSHRWMLMEAAVAVELVIVLTRSMDWYSVDRLVRCFRRRRGHRSGCLRQILFGWWGKWWVRICSNGFMWWFVYVSCMSMKFNGQWTTNMIDIEYRIYFSQTKQEQKRSSKLFSNKVIYEGGNLQRFHNCLLSEASYYCFSSHNGCYARILDLHQQHIPSYVICDEVGITDFYIFGNQGSQATLAQNILFLNHWSIRNQLCHSIKKSIHSLNQFTRFPSLTYCHLDLHFLEVCSI